MMLFSPPPTALLLLGLVAAAAATAVSGNVETSPEALDLSDNPFYCTLQHSHDADHCVVHDGCYWCQGGSLHGICVSKDQSDAFIHKIPGVKCESSNAPPTTAVEEAPYDASCLVAGLDANDGEQEDDCNAAISQDGSACVWCTGAGVFGLCLSSTQAADASTYLECPVDKRKGDFLEQGFANPLDPTCVTAGYNSEGDAVATCHATSDQEGQSCIWCAADDTMGVCVNGDQADMARQYLHCDDDNDDEHIIVKDEAVEGPYDITCAIAGYTAGDDGQDACKSTDDEDGSPCVWCTNGAQGLCLTDQQAMIAEQINLDCDQGITTAGTIHTTTDKPPADELAAEPTVETPNDVSCFLATVGKADDDAVDVCKTSHDMDGAACVWCNYQNRAGVCMNQDQSNYAQQWLDCSEPEGSVVTNKDQVSPFDVTCAMAGMSDGADVCTNTDDEDGQACVWCMADSGGGVCMTHEQAQMAEKVGIQCTAASSDETPIMKLFNNILALQDNPYDATCAVSGVSGDTCDDTVDQDGLACVSCAGNICLTQEQAAIADGMGVDCTDPPATTTALQDNPYDVTCAIAGYTAGDDGEDACKSTDDQDGDACIWCSYGGQGLCLTDEQAQIAGQMQFECSASSSSSVQEAVVQDNPYDVTCAIAGYTAGDDGQDACQSTDDEDGSACVWCSYGGQGVCLTDEQAQIAGQMQFECSTADVAGVEDNPYDVTCAIAGYSAGSDGEDACKTTQDQEGDTCVWCSYGGQGLCLTDEQASIADQMSFDCDEGVALEGNPYDVTCAIAGYTAGDDGEDACKTTQDQEGDTCVWCSYGGQGICVTDEQASIADQMNFDCNEDKKIEVKKVEDNPYDVTCAIAGYSAGSDGEDACKSTDDQDGDACVWCSYGGQGLCLTDEQAQIAGQMQFECDSQAVVSVEETIEASVEDNPYDVTCAIAGYSAGSDGEDACKSTQDQDGDTCVWCSYGGQGLCLTDEQASIADQINFDCNEAKVVEADSYDVTCTMAGYSAGNDGENVCKTTQDEDGDACVWCSYAGEGLCLTGEQAAIAEETNLECNMGSVAVEKEVESNPYDMSCGIAGYTAGADGANVCRQTEDQEGDMCRWCSYGGQGLCLTDDQASIVKQMNFECDAEVEDPIPPTVKDCLKNIQEDDCNGATDENGDRCTWCNTVVNFGLCFSEEAKEIAQAQFGPLFQCDDTGMASMKTAIE